MGALPILAFRDEIVAAVAANQAVIIQADTGAGKSTQVPQYLLNVGYDIVVTQPRRLAAQTVAERVAEELGQEIGQTVGYRLGGGVNKCSEETRCTFVTDGLQLVRQLAGNGRTQVLVLDEVHEWNLNIEVLLAWAKSQLAAGASFKLVVMSATLDALPLSEFLGGAPVITVPGRLHPILDQAPSRDMIQDVVELVQAGRNVLVFQPGKAEIEKMILELRELGLDAEILPLHGQLTPQEQAKCFQKYRRPKIVVSTNVAQTSVTIDDIDAVVDSGMERRTELSHGVEGLYLKFISLADSKQRRGRAGRTKPGIYIDHCTEPNREDFPIAEILRTRLDQTVLRLAVQGFDMEELMFFHQPDHEEIHNAKRTLRLLGLIEEDGRVTEAGKKVARLPVSVQFGRMIIEAEKLGVVDDVLIIAAILENGGITDRSLLWRSLVFEERESDVMAQLSIYRQTYKMRAQEARDNGIHTGALKRVKNSRDKLERALKGRVKLGSSGNRENILRAVVAGMVDHVYHISYRGYENGGTDPHGRMLARESVVSKSTEWVVGLPFDLQTRRGSMLRLLQLATRVSSDMLAEVAPQLVERGEGRSPRYSPERDAVVVTIEVRFNGHILRTEHEECPDHPGAPALLIEGRNARQLEEFVPPEIRLPVKGKRGEIAPVLEVQYGADAADGSPLMAYVTAAPYRGWSTSDPDFTVKWGLDRASIEEQNSLAAEKLRRLNEIIEAEEAAEAEIKAAEEAKVRQAEADEDRGEVDFSGLLSRFGRRHKAFKKPLNLFS